MIVVTAPTGHIGSEVLAGLLSHDEAVRVVVRDPDRLPAALRDRVEIVPGTHRDRDVVERAFDGADAVFWLVPADPKAASIYDAYVGFSLAAADAIHHHEVPRVVTVSALGRGAQRYAGHVSATIAMDEMIRSTGAHVRELANPSFMDNVARQVASIRDRGVLSATLPADLKLPTIATRDIAAAAVPLLLQRSWVGQETVNLLGPEDLSQNDLAAILTDVLDKPVRYERGDRAEDKQTFLKYGMSDAVAQALIDMDLAKEHGIDTVVARTPQNSTPTTFRQWATDVLKPAVEPR